MLALEIGNEQFKKVSKILIKKNLKLSILLKITKITLDALSQLI